MPSNFNMIYDKYKLSVKDKVLLVDVTGSWTIKDIDNDISNFKANLDTYEYESVQYDFLKLNNCKDAFYLLLLNTVLNQVVQWRPPTCRG